MPGTLARPMAGASSSGSVPAMPPSTDRAALEAAVDAYVAAWNETDPAERARLLAGAVADDFEFHGPTGTFRGRVEVEALIVALQTRLAGAMVARQGPVTEGVFRWAIVSAAGATLLEGSDEATAGDEGRLVRISVAAGAPPPQVKRP